jgi:hypothetical protein
MKSFALVMYNELLLPLGMIDDRLVDKEEK